MMTNAQHDSNWLNVFQNVLPGICSEQQNQTNLMIMKHLWESGTIRDDSYQLWLLRNAKVRGIDIPTEALTDEAKEKGLT